MENLFEELIFTLENIGHPVQEIDLKKIAGICPAMSVQGNLTFMLIHHLSVEEKQRLHWQFSLL